ncbi:hypothetical protein [Haloferax chudinovii]|uniref:Uncharacterized protein n=1 Tax=Haloferax chudinovii TaxID=1109010 RepID=A0ABD5XJM4_9EURY
MYVFGGLQLLEYLSPLVLGGVYGLVWIGFNLVTVAARDATLVFSLAPVVARDVDRKGDRAKYLGTVFAYSLLGVGVAVSLFEVALLAILYGAVVGGALGDRLSTKPFQAEMLQFGLRHVVVVALGVVGSYVALRGPAQLLVRSEHLVGVALRTWPAGLQFAIDFVLGVLLGVVLGAVMMPLGLFHPFMFVVKRLD